MKNGLRGCSVLHPILQVQVQLQKDFLVSCLLKGEDHGHFPLIDMREVAKSIV